MYMYIFLFFFLRFTHISNEFGKLGFTKVKDLAGTTLGKASSIKMSGDTLTQLIEAMEVKTNNIHIFRLYLCNYLYIFFRYIANA